MEMKEKELIKKAQQGDQQALASIVTQYERLVFNLGLKLLGNEEEAECVLQETFLKVLQSIKKFKAQSSLSTWIYRIATNQALMRLRNRKRQFVSLDNDDNDSQSQKDYSKLSQSLDASPLDNLMNEELKEKMAEGIELLPPKYKSVFVLKDIEDLSLKEIGEMLDMSLPAVKSNLHRARLFLREQLAELFDERA
ncbi:sigma-70 family RNA polymerase sigma factor [candidate division KSB1 bacterium]|nr:sigma-70 family RNA polymerase sigma factor [candidate division KSB1 bacterium]